MSQRVRWKVVPSERKVLGEFSEDDNMNNCNWDHWNHDLMRPVEYMVEEIVQGFNEENISNPADNFVMFKPPDDDCYYNDNFVKQSDHNGFLFVNQFDSSRDLGSHGGGYMIAPPPPLINYPTPGAPHGPCCTCPCHNQYSHCDRPQALSPGTSYLAGYTPAGGTVHIVCLAPPSLPPLPPIPVAPSQGHWVVGDSIQR